MRFTIQTITTTRRHVRVCTLLLVLAGSYCRASPWIEVGDERTRHHLQYLNDSGAINLPLTTWPLSWADVNREIDTIFLNDLSRTQLWSYRYLKHTLKRAAKRAKTSKQLYGSNSIAPFTHFASDTREESFIGSKTTIMGNHLALNVEVKALRNPIDDDDFQFEGSYLAASIGNWIIGAGAVDRWWGPGWLSSLILSNAARPAPGIFAHRKEAVAFKLPVVALLGPWTLDIFANQLEEDRHIANAKLLGARFTCRPLAFLEFGHSRVAMWGGDDRVESLSGLLDIALLNDPVIQTRNENGFGDVREESNQLISYDARLNLRIHSMNFAFYGQYLTNEDQSYADAETATMFGVETAFALGAAHNRLAFEIADTRNDLAAGSRRNNNAIYDHGSYFTGFRYHERAIGEAAGTNARKISLLGDHYLSMGHQFSWRVSKVELNEHTFSNNFYTSNYLDQEIGEATYKVPVNSFLQASAGAFVVKEKMRLGTREIDSGAMVRLEFRF